MRRMQHEATSKTVSKEVSNASEDSEKDLAGSIAQEAVSQPSFEDRSLIETRMVSVV